MVEKKKKSKTKGTLASFVEGSKAKVTPKPKSLTPQPKGMKKGC